SARWPAVSVTAPGGGQRYGPGRGSALRPRAGGSVTAPGGGQRYGPGRAEPARGRLFGDLSGGGNQPHPISTRPPPRRMRSHNRDAVARARRGPGHERRHHVESRLVCAATRRFRGDRPGADRRVTDRRPDGEPLRGPLLQPLRLSVCVLRLTTGPLPPATT